VQKNITLNADEALIRKARQRARSEHTSLNEVFRAWLKRYAVRDSAAGEYDKLMDSFGHVDAGRSFTRDETNER